MISEVLDRIADRHSTPPAFLDDASRDLDEARQFVAQKHLVTLPPQANLQVIPTPVFMRGAYAVGGFNPAPPLEPRLGAFYWVTPIPAEWDQPRIESKLREYNFYKLKLLTLHEAIPGHYVQAEYANADRTRHPAACCARSTATRPTWKAGRNTPLKPCWTKDFSIIRRNCGSPFKKKICA